MSYKYYRAILKYVSGDEHSFSFSFYVKCAQPQVMCVVALFKGCGRQVRRNDDDRHILDIMSVGTCERLSAADDLRTAFGSGSCAHFPPSLLLLVTFYTATFADRKVASVLLVSVVDQRPTARPPFLTNTWMDEHKGQRRRKSRSWSAKRRLVTIADQRAAEYR